MDTVPDGFEPDDYDPIEALFRPVHSPGREIPLPNDCTAVKPEWAGGTRYWEIRDAGDNHVDAVNVGAHPTESTLAATVDEIVADADG